MIKYLQDSKVIRIFASEIINKENMFKIGDYIQYKDCHSLPPREIIGEDYERCVYIVSDGRYGSFEVPFINEYRYEKVNMSNNK